MKLAIRIIALAALVGLAAAPARADWLRSLPEPDYAAPAKNAQQQALPESIRHLVYPTIGCPSVLAPGEELTPVVWLPNGGITGDWRARLVTAREAHVQTIPLGFIRASFDAATGTYRLAFEVPPGAPEDCYDLFLESASLPGTSDHQPNAVRVLRSRTTLDIAHVADTQLRDPTTRYPQKFGMLLEELRLRDPAFVLYSGDLNFGLDYVKEYPENREILRAGGVAMVCAPGNHDGYSWMLTSTTPLYDGLYLWRRTIGPTYFSVRYGGMRIIAANTYGGTTVRRNAYTFLCHNSGGEIEAPQLAWIEAEARDAGAAGEETLIFLHHNPKTDGNLTPTVPGYPWTPSLVGAAQGTWNDKPSRDEMTRIIGENPRVKWILAGHTNHDEHLVRTIGTGATAHEVHYVNTTSPCNGGNPKEGYRWIRMSGGTITDLDYEPAQPSVPFPLGGNLAATFLDPNDGGGTIVRARVTNALSEAVDVTLRFFVRPDPRGYLATAGFVREVGAADSGAYVVYVRATVPANGSVEPGVIPDPSGKGARPAALGGTYSTGVQSGSGPGSGGGGGCTAGGEASAAATWAIGLALLLALDVALRRRG